MKMSEEIQQKEIHKLLHDYGEDEFGDVRAELIQREKSFHEIKEILKYEDYFYKLVENGRFGLIGRFGVIHSIGAHCYIDFKKHVALNNEDFKIIFEMLTGRTNIVKVQEVEQYGLTEDHKSMIGSNGYAVYPKCCRIVFEIEKDGLLQGETLVINDKSEAGNILLEIVERMETWLKGIVCEHYYRKEV